MVKIELGLYYTISKIVKKISLYSNANTSYHPETIIFSIFTIFKGHNTGTVNVLTVKIELDVYFIVIKIIPKY